MVDGSWLQELLQRAQHQLPELNTLLLLWQQLCKEDHFDPTPTVALLSYVLGDGKVGKTWPLDPGYLMNVFFFPTNYSWVRWIANCLGALLWPWRPCRWNSCCENKLRIAKCMATIDICIIPEKIDDHSRQFKNIQDIYSNSWEFMMLSIKGTNM